VQVATEADDGPVAQSAARVEFLAIADLAVEMPAKPAFALGQEGLDVAFRVRPATTAWGRDRYNDATLGMDDNPEAARSWRPSKCVRQRAAGELGDGGALRGGHLPMVPRPTAGHASSRLRPGPSGGLC
jgi:hypothetical protein